MAKSIEHLKWLVLLTAVLTWAGCSGDGSTLGPDGTPLDDSVVNGDGDNGDNGDNGDGDNGDDVPAVTLAQLSSEIFTPRCALSGCHSGGIPTGGMSLTADRIATEIINVASSGKSGEIRVVPGESANSYILKKLRGESGISGSQMPLVGSPLTSAQLDLIAQWIDAGAKTE